MGGANSRQTGENVTYAHHEASANFRKLVSENWNYLDKNPSQVFHPPFDVRLPQNDSKSDTDIITVLQPDLTIICDPTKIDERGCLGAPDWVIEILSRGNARRDTHDKLSLYEQAGVREYWIVHPTEETVIKYSPNDQGNYVGSKPYARGERIPVSIFPGFAIDLEDIFKD